MVCEYLQANYREEMNSLFSPTVNRSCWFLSPTSLPFLSCNSLQSFCQPQRRQLGTCDDLMCPVLMNVYCMYTYKQGIHLYVRSSRDLCTGFWVARNWWLSHLVAVTLLEVEPMSPRFQAVPLAALLLWGKEEQSREWTLWHHLYCFRGCNSTQ